MKADFRIVEDKDEEIIVLEGEDVVEDMDTFEDDDEGYRIPEDTYELPPEENTNESVVRNIPPNNDEVAVNEELVYQPAEVNVSNNQATQEVIDSGVTFRLCQLFETTFIEGLREKSASEIKEIWEVVVLAEDHSLSFTIESGTHDVIDTKTNIYGEFVVPIPRSHVYQFFKILVHNNCVQFFPVDPMQTNVAECLGIYFYTEYKQDKGIVLVRGKFDENVLEEMEGIRNMTPQVRLPIMNVSEQSKSEEEEKSNQEQSSATESENEGATEDYVKADEEVESNIDSTNVCRTAEGDVEVEDGGGIENEVNCDFETTSQSDRETQIDSDLKACSVAEDDTELCDEVGKKCDDVESSREVNIKIEENIENDIETNEEVRYEDEMAMDVDASNEIVHIVESNNEAKYEMEYNGNEMDADFEASDEQVHTSNKPDDEIVSGSEQRVEFNYNGNEFVADDDEGEYTFESGDEIDDNVKINEVVERYEESDIEVAADFEVNCEEDVPENHEANYTIEYSSGSDNETVVELEGKCNTQDSDGSEEEMASNLDEKSNDEVQEKDEFEKEVASKPEKQANIEVQDNVLSNDVLLSNVKEKMNSKFENNAGLEEIASNAEEEAKSEVGLVDVDRISDNKCQDLVNGNDEVKYNAKSLTDSLYNRLRGDAASEYDGDAIVKINYKNDGMDGCEASGKDVDVLVDEKGVQISR